MLSAGEESAEITRMCTIVACQHERDAESLAKGLSTVIEPLLVVLIAGVVLLVALAIFLPMWNMVSILG
jgi:MSHA biogenesis protein MshG